MLFLGASCANVSHVDGRLTSANEKRTINQAQAAWGIGGAIIGAGAGLLLAKLTDMNDAQTTATVLTTGALGYGVGRNTGQKKGVIAVQQKRGVKMEKTRLDKLIADARGYNQQAAKYNADLSRQIGVLEKQSADPALRPAVAKRASAESRFASKQIGEIDDTIKMRGKFIKDMHPSQRERYDDQKEVLEAERERLRKSVIKLNSIETRASGG